MIKLYCFPRSGNSREVKIAMAEKNIPFESFNIRDEAVKADPDFLKASPNKKVPAIVDQDVYMQEAYDINVYLNEKYPGINLIPEAVNESDIRSWVKQYEKSLCLQIGLLLIETLLKPKAEQKEELKEKFRKNIQQGLKELNEKLEGQEFIFGDYSLADIAITPHLSALPRVGLAIGDDYSNVKAWYERIQQRPSFAQSADPKA